MQIANDEEHGTLYSWSYFHVVFAFACLYLTMVLTNWAILQSVKRYIAMEIHPLPSPHP